VLKTPKRMCDVCGEHIPKERTTEESQRVLKPQPCFPRPTMLGLIPLAFGNYRYRNPTTRYRPKAVIRRLALGQRRRKAALSGFSSTTFLNQETNASEGFGSGGTYTERPHDGSPRAA